MTDQDIVYLKVTVSKVVGRRFKVYLANKYPYSLRGPLSIEVEKALIYYLDSKENGNSKGIKDLDSTHTHTLQQQHKHPNQQNNNNKSNSKYDTLVETIKQYSNSQKQISSGLVKRAISQTIGMDKRTITKYLKILQDNDVLYSSSIMGMFDVQSWIYGDYVINKQLEEQQSLVDVL